VIVDNIPDARKLGQGLRDDSDRVRARTRAALDALAELAIVDRSRLAAIGYCMGGSFALELARSGAPIRAVVAFHAGLETTAPAHRGQIKASVLVCTGADDSHITIQHVGGFVEEMRAAEVDYEIDVYGGAQHGFTVRDADRRGIPGLAYNAKADARSWETMLRFLGEIFVAG